MLAYGAAMSVAASAREAARAAAIEAAAGMPSPKLAIVFASASYEDLAAVNDAIVEVLPGVQVIGGTSARCVFGPRGTATRGVSVGLIGGTGFETASRTVAIETPDLLEVVPVAEELAREAEDAARRGYPQHACIVFAPSMRVDGEALVMTVRKGVGARTQLAGALTGDELTMDRPKVFADGALRNDRVVLASLFTRRPLGIAARHGWHAVGPVRTVTHADGVQLLGLDGRPALAVWLEDARAEGARPPDDRQELAVYLTNEFLIGVDDAPRSAPPSTTDDPIIVRAPLKIGQDGSIRLSGAIAEGTHVRLVRATAADLLRASAEAASAAVLRATPPVVGAVVLSCSSRIAALGDCFEAEPAEIQRRVRAPMAGACVYGEIARNVRDVDAFFNTTTVVIALGA